MVIPVLALAIALGLLRDCDYARSDLAAAYSGTVVAEGSDYHILQQPTWHYYIVIQDSTGHRRKRYVDRNGYFAAKVGSFIVKQQGLGEIPHVADSAP
jgi:hypothetical protein